MTNKKRKILLALFSIVGGTFVGSVSSALMLFIHYPDSDKNLGSFIQNGIAAFLFSPLSMTIGIFPTFGFYGWIHGATALFGMFLAVTCLIFYFKTSIQWIISLVTIGFALWASNNYLSWAAMMSV
jgi:hypothetical protein